MSDMTTSHSNFTFVSARGAHPKRIQDQVWDQHKDEITKLYCGDKNSLENVMEYMKEKHDFNATKRQYIHRMEKWGLKKYSSSRRERAAEAESEEEAAGRLWGQPKLSFGEQQQQQQQSAANGNEV